MKNKFVLIAGFAALTLLFTSCASRRPESEVLIRRLDSNADARIKVFIDGKQAGVLRIGQTATYKVENGEHTIYVSSGDSNDKDPKVLAFTSYESRHVFSVTDGVITPLEGDAKVQQLSRNGYGEISPVSYDLNKAVKTSFYVISKAIKSKTKVAVINIATDNRAEGTFVIEELTYQIINSKSPKLSVIDRRKIEEIRIEKNFDRTTSYEDDFLVSIGSLLGANVIITGNIIGSGELRRLRIKALDVKTGRLIGMASERV